MSNSALKVCIASVSPQISTGYGQGTRTLTHMLLDMGYQVCIYSVFGHAEHVSEYVYKDKSVKIYPIRIDGNNRLAGLDIVELKENFDCMVTFFDLFAFQTPQKRYPVLSLVMLDAEPYLSANYNAMKIVDNILAVSKYAEKELNNLRTKEYNGSMIIEDHQLVSYMPLITDENDYYVIDKAKARQTFNNYFGLELKGNLITTVAANLEDGGSERKNLPELLLFWNNWQKVHADDYLYLHTDIGGNTSKGLNINKFLKNMNIPTDRIVFANPLLYKSSEYNVEYMRSVYNASDVMVVPSHSEGFGLPLCEAAMCGTIPVANKFGTGYEVITNCLGQGIECRPSYFCDGAMKSKSYNEDIFGAVEKALNSSISRTARSKVATSYYGVEANKERLRSIIESIKQHPKYITRTVESREKIVKIKDKLYNW